MVKKSGITKNLLVKPKNSLVMPKNSLVKPKTNLVQPSILQLSFLGVGSPKYEFFLGHKSLPLEKKSYFKETNVVHKKFRTFCLATPIPVRFFVSHQRQCPRVDGNKISIMAKM